MQHQIKMKSSLKEQTLLEYSTDEEAVKVKHQTQIQQLLFIQLYS